MGNWPAACLGPGIPNRHYFTPIRMSLIRELWAFLKHRKKWVLLPVILAMLLVGSLLVFAETSALAPFIYTIF